MGTSTRIRNLLLATGLAVPLAIGAWASEARATPWLGVYSQEITPELREGLDYNGTGVLIRRVVPDSPADRAGIQRGDVVVRIGSHQVHDPGELASVVRSMETDQAVPIEVIRDGRSRVLNATLEERSEQGSNPDENNDVAPPQPPPPPVPGEPDHAAPHALHSHSHDEMRDHDSGDDNSLDFPIPDMGDMNGLPMMGRGRLGVRIESLNPDLASYFGSRDAKGALVLDVTEDSPAEHAGIRPGDVIMRVESQSGAQKVESADDLMRAIQNADGQVALTVLRHGSRETIEAKLGPRDRILRLRGGPNGAFQWRQGPNGERQRVRSWQNPDRGNAPEAPKRIVIDGDEDSKSNADLRRELDDLREELRQLKEELHNK